jgi:NADPH:quinone reductase-like Zn-dependent oxidoreductase
LGFIKTVQLPTLNPPTSSKPFSATITFSITTTTMKAIQVTTWGQPPAFNPSAADMPPPKGDEIQLKVLASGLHRLIRSQAMGTHYSARSLPLPYTPGADGVGLTPDNKRVFFSSMGTGGGFGEYVNVHKDRMIELSPDADETQVAGLMNPGMSSWMAIKSRVKGLDLDKPWTVVILGVTSQSGKVAVEFVRHLGASRVVGVARDEGKMKGLGLDEIIVLKDNVTETDFGKMGDVDVVLDYLYGAPFAECLSQLKSAKSTQVVQIGSMAGLESSIPAALLRSKDVTIRGSGPGAWSMQQFASEAEGLLRAVEKLSKQAITLRGLDEIDAAWGNERERTVFVPSK